MRPNGWWTTAFWCCKTMQWIAGTGLVLFAIIQPMDESLKNLSIVGDLIASLRPFSRPAVVAFGAGVVLFKYLAHLIGPPWVWAAIHAIFDEVRERAFRYKEGEPVHHHRVTLFEHVHFWRIWRLWLCLWQWKVGRFPWSGWLIPSARSGHTTKSCSTRFLAPDDADRAEGVVGQAWATNSQILVDKLPEVSESSSSTVIAEYATRTFVTPDWVKDRLGKPLPRSLCGVPIEVEGRIWGVLVLDSRAEDGIKSQKVTDLVDFVGIVLRHLLRRAK